MNDDLKQEVIHTVLRAKWDSIALCMMFVMFGMQQAQTSLPAAVVMGLFAALKFYQFMKTENLFTELTSTEKGKDNGVSQ